MIKPMSIAFVALSLLTPLALASPAGPEQSLESFWQGRDKVSTIMPIFGQLVQASYPKGFQIAPVYEKVVSGQYTRETVLEGENVNTWTQMITIASAKGLASNPEATPRKVLENIARGYRNACQNSFSAAVRPDTQIGGRDAFIAMVSCGSSPLTQGRTSETALIVVVKGEQDYYNFKWSERTAPSSTPMAIDTAMWAARLELLMPIRLCPIVPGEAAPYPSCIDRK